MIEPPVLRTSLGSEPLSLDWHSARSSIDRFIIGFMMRGLLRYEGGGTPVCDLCKSFTVSPDGKVYRFELNTTEEWSDGERLDASQFVDSFRRLLDPDNHFKVADEYRVIAGAVQAGKKWDPKKLEVLAESSSRLEIRLSEPITLFKHLLTHIASFPLRKSALREMKTGTAPVIGPYQLVAWEKGKRLVLEGNPRFVGKRPVYRVDFVIAPHAQLVSLFKRGRLDLLAGPTTEDLVGMQGRKLQVSPYLATRLLMFNFRKKLMNEVALRSAILYSLDRGAVPSFLKNGERGVTGVIPPSMPGYRELPLVTADPARAQAERARVTRSNPGSGEIQLTLITQQTETERVLTEWIGEQLARIKIALKVEALPSQKYYARLDSGGFDLALHTWAFDLATPLDLLKGFQTGAASNRGHWTHVVYDALYTQLVYEQKPQDHAQLLDRITQLLETQEVATIPLGYPSLPFLLGSRVNSFAMTPFGDPDLVRIELRH